MCYGSLVFLGSCFTNQNTRKNFCYLNHSTTSHEKEEMEIFYEDIEKEKQQCKHHEIMLLMSDFNSKVGKGKFFDIVGPH